MKPKKKKGLGSNHEIMLTTYLFVFLFIGMIGYLVYFVATNEQELLNNSYNTRQELLLSQNYRGTIYAAGGEILADTTVNEEEKEIRVYPYKNLFAHIIGYSTNGKMGVESIANYYLINTNTSLANKVANEAAGIKNPGDSVYTTLDVVLQEVASDEMGIYKGAIVVTEVATGKILAMVSQPDFDPNKIGQIWNNLVEDTESSVLVNRATQGLYPPGSTFKIVTALEYIRENPEMYMNYHYNCNGSYQNGDSKISCYHGTKHGEVDFYKSFAKSCNSSFANIGMNLHKTSFAQTIKELLFNQSLPLNLASSKSSVSVSEDMLPGQMMQVSIGQGTTQMAPIHLNMITSAIANGGILMKPYVIDRVENDVGSIVKSFKPESYGEVMSEEEAAILTELMEEVVKTGTATKLNGLDYTVAGKTGSAEYNNVKGDSHAWFTGFAPAQNPQICVTIILEGAGSGGDYAVPIAKRIFEAYFRGKAYNN